MSSPKDTNPASANLAQLPSMTRILGHPVVAALSESKGRDWSVQAARKALSSIRDQAANYGLEQSKEELTACIAARLVAASNQEDSRGLQQVINATGILLHTNLGRAPLADAAVQRVRDTAAYTNIEIDLGNGLRSKRGLRCTELLSQICGSEAAIVVNNCAAATLLALAATAFGRQVVISRGQLVEIGGGFRLPEVFQAAGVQLAEVGTTNRTYVRDYENSLTDGAAAILRVHRSNFSLSGFCTEPTTAELARLAETHQIPLIDDLGSGLLDDLSDVGLVETRVQQSVTSNADLTLFSGDKLLGGPQCGIVVGKSRWVECLRQHPLMRAMRVCKMTLAALEATLELYAAKRTSEIPLHAMLRLDQQAVRSRCKKVVANLIESPFEYAIVDTNGFTGGGTLPGAELPSASIAIVPITTNSSSSKHQSSSYGGKIDALSKRLRQRQPAIVGRIQEDRLLLDLRTVLPDQIDALTAGLNSALAQANDEANCG